MIFSILSFLLVSTDMSGGEEEWGGGGNIFFSLIKSTPPPPHAKKHKQGQKRANFFRFCIVDQGKQ
jgi:hypothetical protein